MFSYEMLMELKKLKGFDKDYELANILPKATRSVISEIKSGKRHLTEEQAVFIATECKIDIQWMLVQLAEETAKTEAAKKAWYNLAKKLSKSVTAAALALIVIFSGLDSKQQDSAVLA